MSSIQLRHIMKVFDGEKVLDDINLEVEEGEMVSLLGPSGCGKTTTLKIIAGLIQPEQGDILLGGASILKVPVEKRGTVIVFQDYLLFPHLTIMENVAFGLKMAKVKKAKRSERASEMLKLVHLEEHGEKYPHELSGGQRQRVAIARALAIEPKVLLLDEPFSNLDTRLRENLREFISHLQKKLNITTILVTHDKEEALMTSDKIAVMLEGEIKQFGTPRELYQRPTSPEVADFFGERNYIFGTIEDKLFKSKLGNFKVEEKSVQRVKAMVKPEEVELLSKATNQGVLGKVKARRYGGDRVYYTLDVNGVQLKSVSAAREIFEVGDQVYVHIDFDEVIFYEEKA